MSTAMTKVGGSAAKNRYDTCMSAIPNRSTTQGRSSTPATTWNARARGKARSMLGAARSFGHAIWTMNAT